MYRSIVFNIFLFVSVIYAKHEIYDGYKVFTVAVKNAAQLRLLNNLETFLGLDVWLESSMTKPGMVLVPGDKSDRFEEALIAEEIQYSIEVENVMEMLLLEDQLHETDTKRNRTASKGSPLPLDRIYRYNEINAYMEDLASAYPDTVTLVDAGESFEGRSIKYLKISTTNFQQLNKPVVYIESLLHAREWITQSATLYAIEKLVIDVTEQDLLHDIDWIIMPIANPDGYEFTHTDQRLWRKNRATGYMPGDLCSGVDLNRNFDTFWSQASSSIVCMDTFHGRAPFSEPETAIIRDIISEHGDRMELFLDIHSFGSMILYGYGTGNLPPNGLNLHLVGVRMAQAIDNVKMSWNDNYIVGNVALVLYQASGSAMDYAQSVGVPLSYTYELPGYRFGFGTAAGFFVDPEFIRQAGFETWEGIKTGARNSVRTYKQRISNRKVIV